MPSILPRIVAVYFILCGNLVLAIPAGASTFQSAWPEGVERVWVGPDYWANRLQDWRVAGGRLECAEARAAKPMRTVHLLTHRLGRGVGWLEMSVRTGVIGDAGATSGRAATGFLIGAGGRELDYRAAALIHHTPGPGGGLFAGVDGNGRAFIRDFAAPDQGFTPPAGVVPRDKWKLVHADSVEPGNEAEKAFDGDANTIWHTQWRDEKPTHPHELRIDLGGECTINGLVYVPRQDNAAGRIERYAFYTSRDGSAWGEPVCQGSFPNTERPQQVAFDPVAARHIRLVALSAHADRPSTTLAELYVLDAGRAAPAPQAEPAEQPGSVSDLGDTELRLSVRPAGGSYTITVSAHDPETKQTLSEATREGVAPDRLVGSLALASHPGAGQNTARFWFRDWSVSGSKVRGTEEQNCGPILAAQYTVQNGTLKLTAQMMPLGTADNQTVELEIREGNQWQKVAETKIIAPGFTAPFRVENWDAGKARPYRVIYDLRTGDADTRRYEWTGTIRRDPRSKREIVLAAFTGNHNALRGVDRGKSFPWNEGLWFPHSDVVTHVSKHDPDLLFFSGDQVYEGASPTGAEASPVETAELDYLYKWYLWCWAFRDLARDRPCICIPDDHDVYHGNLWGMGGKPGDAQKGGYRLPPEWVNMVERTQTSHLPDPYDPTPVEQGIGVYYTALTVGGIGFAIIEDRKFKSSPTLVEAEKTPDNHIIEQGYDGRKADVPGAELLGERQLEFLRDFCADWQGQVMKAVLSQTIFANLQTREQYPDRLDRDLDSNGWPQSGRARALREMRKGFALHVAGDQHLGSVIHHGIDDWEDAGWSFCVPSIANFYLRFWEPLAPGENQQAGMPPYTGRYLDGLGNRLTVHAVANPTRQPEPGQFPDPVELHRKAPGYGIVRFNKLDRAMTLECWPRYADPGSGSPYPGWPITISQLDNYGCEPVAYLPTIEVTGMADPVLQVIDEADGEIVYTVRMEGGSFRPFVFREGSYTVRVGEPAEGKVKVLEHVRASENGGEPVRLRF